MDWDRPAGKRRRTDEEEACEALGGLLRQTAARAMDRVRLLRQQRSGDSLPTTLPASVVEAIMRNVKPMDVLVIRFCTHYLDCSAVAAANQFVRLAQELITASVERVIMPQLFSRDGNTLPALCEALVAEHTAEEIQVTVKEVNEFVEARGALGAWIADATARRGDRGEEEGYDSDDYGAEERVGYRDRGDMQLKDEEGDGEDEAGDDKKFLEGGDKPSVPVTDRVDFALATTLYQACEYWVRVQAFLNALSLHSAQLHVFSMPPRYERELLLLLYAATRGSAHGGLRDDRRGAGTPPVALDSDVKEETFRSGEASSTNESTATGKTDYAGTVKQEPDWDNDGNFRAEGGDADGTNGEELEGAQQPQQLYKASALLADVLALSRCPLEPSSSSSGPGGSRPMSSTSPAGAPRISADAAQHLKGLNSDFYKMVYARLGVMVARDRLHRFDRVSTVTPPPLTVQQRNVNEQLLEQQRLQREKADIAAAAFGLPGQADEGLPATYVPDDAYYEKLLHQQHDTIDEDEELYKGEVLDYYLTHPNRSSGAASTAATRSSRFRSNRGGRGDAEATPLMKPHRFCKVKTGFTWTQYNRTHYDSRTNPPPRTEMWYEFTLFYPALANTKRDMRNIFRIEDAPEGPNDQYCLLVFSVGPPYADVAYRIRKKQWDTRRGGVRINFDQYGRYKLFFRFTNSNYRR